ncbi:MAG: mlaF [Rhizobacter sp.]|jgi:phospholipid/cholesterol/gamma-HCH transport system ATP-binding protein|nr:mlaF [Rhizobacter sp.]
MAVVQVDDLKMAFGSRLIQQHVSLKVEKGCIFAVMGGSGCGKSTLLKHMVGLLPPAGGKVTYDGADFWASNEEQRRQLRSRFGMLFQSAALWSSMTVLENIVLPLKEQTKLNEKEREAKAREVLEWVELAQFADFFPADLSGGMKKRVGLARAIAAEPPLLFLDEPSAGLDPISSRRLDDLVLDIRKRTGAAVVFVSHELPSLFAIADDGIFLDADSKQPIAHGRPRDLADTADHPTVRAFLHREVPPPAPAADSPTTEQTPS